jgi:hypothetical protein
MVNQLSTPGADEMSPRTTPQSPAAGRTVDPGLLYIDGVWREASDGGTAPTITPIDESEITTVAQATESDLESAVAAARTAFDEGPWPGLNVHERAKVLRRITELVEQNLDELAYLESIDLGKPIAMARAIDAPMTAQIFHYYSGMATQLEGSTRGGSSPTTHPFPVAGLNYTEREPYVHVKDLAELFCLAAEFAPHGAILHGAADDVTQRDLAPAINRMIGTDERTGQSLAVADSWHRRQHSRRHRRLVHPTGHCCLRYQPVAEQTPVFGQDTQAPRLVTQTHRHRRRHRVRLVRDLIARALQPSRST